MLDEKSGFINQVILGWLPDHSIPWLTDGARAKAARIDGAGPMRTVFSVKLPLVLQSTVPLLISSFAVTFNNTSP